MREKHVRLFENTYVNSEKHVRLLNCEYWEIVRILYCNQIRKVTHVHEAM